jgi:hypothetical protein
LRIYSELTGRQVIPDRVLAKLEDGGPGRIYDGLSPNGDGTYQGIEVKPASSPYLRGGQGPFDAAVNAGTPATATLDGETIVLTSTRLILVP